MDFQKVIQVQIQDYHKKLGNISNEEIESNLKGIFNRATQKYKMKCEHILSVWKEKLIDKMENISDYQNQLLIGRIN